MRKIHVAADGAEGAGAYIVIMRRLPPLNALRAFEATARLGSIAAAAAELHVTAGAVSKQVRALEESFGRVLFERSARGNRLTPEGRALAAGAREAFDRILDVSQTIRPDPSRGVSITTLASFAGQWLIPRVDAFEADCGLRLHVRTGSRIENLEQDSIDFAIRFGDGRWPGVTATPFGPARYALVAAPNVAEALGEVRTPDDLASVTLLYGDGYDDWRDILGVCGARALDQAEHQPFQDNNVMVEAVLRGRGVGLLPTLLVADGVRSGRLTRILDVPSPGPAHRSFFVAHATEKRLRREARDAIDWLTAEVDRTPID